MQDSLKWLNLIYKVIETQIRLVWENTTPKWNDEALLLTETPHHWQHMPAKHSADQQVFLHSRHFELPAKFPSLQWWYWTTGACNRERGISQLCKNNLLHTVYPSNILPLCLLSFLCLFPAIVSAVPQYQRSKAVYNRSNKYESRRSHGYPKTTRTVAHSFWLRKQRRYFS